MRREFWETLSLAVRSDHKAWACIGDFNDLLSSDEKLGGRPVTDHSHFFLKNFLNDLSGLTIGFNGNMFT